ncbi:hypothetical protein QTQ03_06690 [Micromonospora sp. WMMA1363]|uniref:hypothetical protein n=1 Tax=Micromonospora sp. WMMA1363 TaxID=3053985 RepID=UPI00259D0D94|nr:hypothetical protein [Micromonospora sp. WMMA1363]MDM4719299.1 hypothetical protein [Micromonospora sp. WMMA1363]
MAAAGRARGRRTATATLLALVVGATQTGPAPAAAAPAGVTATVYSYLPTKSEYRVDSRYATVSTGGGVVVRRTGTGAYTVILEEAASDGGVAHVTAYGDAPVHCTLASCHRAPFGGADEHLQVRCFSAGGTPTDSRFVATFSDRRRASQGRLAWFATDQAAPAGPRILDSVHSYDSTGGSITYERFGTGHYTFQMNANPAGEDAWAFPMVHVTAVAGSAVNCQIAWPDRWEVWCVDVSGTPIDARFALSYGKRVDLLGHATGVRFATGTLYGEEATGGELHGDSYNSTRSGSGARRILLDTGRYEIQFVDVGTTYGTPFGNAHVGNKWGSVPRGHCVVRHWRSTGLDAVVQLNCYAWGGKPADLNARVSYTTWPAG